MQFNIQLLTAPIEGDEYDQTSKLMFQITDIS